MNTFAFEYNKNRIYGNRIDLYFDRHSVGRKHSCHNGQRRSGGFATPAMVALMENAAMNAVVGELPEGATTVGAMMNTTHIKPSAMGDTVSATAVLKEVAGRKLTFEVHAKDSKGVIGEGMHVRYIVDREKFMSKLS